MGSCKKNQTHFFYLRSKINRYGLTLLHASFLFWLSCPLFCDPIRILPSDTRFEILHSTDNDGIPDIFITNPAIENSILNHSILRGTVWAKRVEVNMEGLKSASRQETESIQIPLSEDQTLLGKIDTVILRSGTEFTLSGILNEEPASSFTITVNDLSVSGGFRTGDGRHYELYYDAIEKCHALAEINDGLAIHPNQIHDLDDVPIPLTQRNQPLAVPASDDGTVLDMMIIYTPAARAAAGGTSSILAICDRAVDEMNLIFKKSGVIPRVRLVHKKEIAYTELRNESGGVMDHEDRAALENMSEVNTLRDQYGADMVSFFTVGIGSGVLVWPYSLTGWDCAISSYTFAHEAGHGMGCHHAVGDTWDGNPPGQAKGSGKFPYSHGWHLFIGTQRYSTVMAYPSPDNYRYSTWATQIPHYSNPNITFQGISTGNRINGEDDANNARTINEMAYTIANWKASKSVPASPANVKASEVDDYTDKVRITWSPSTGATYYRVYRTKVIGEIPTPVSEWQTMTSFNDTTAPPWQTYWYAVKAAKSNTGSLPSEFSIFDSGERGLPPPEINASGGSFSDKVRISWDAVEGADTYRVYRSDSLTGTKQPISNWIAATYFDDTNTTVLVKYYYWVQSSIGQGNIASDYSQSDYGWRYISTPTGVTASNGTSSEYVEITWNAVEGATHYRVYRSDSQEGSKTGVSSWIANTLYHDTSAVGNKVYYYWVGASINSTGFDSVMSSESDSGWRKLLPSPTPTPTKTRTPTRTPVPIDRTPTPHFVTPTPITFVTPKPTFQIITPTPTPYTVLAIGGGNIETAVWKSVTIPILAQNLANTKSIYCEITYDKNLLTWEGEYSKENTLLSSWSAVDVQSISTNRLQFGAACFGQQGVSGNGTLINLNFIAKIGTASSTTTRIQFARFGDNVKNAKGLPIVVTIKNSQDPLKGDVNGDGLLANEDAQLTFDIFNKEITPSDYQTWAADFNNDAKVTPFDAQSIYEAILQR